jgi:hypothetical protein
MKDKDFGMLKDYQVAVVQNGETTKRFSFHWTFRGRLQERTFVKILANVVNAR